MSVTGGRTFFCAFALSVLLLLFASLSAAGALVASAINFFCFATFGGFSAFAGFSFGGVADFAGFTGFGFAAAALDGGVGVALTGVDGASALLIVGAKQNLKFLPTRELLNSSSRIF
jgi:hypothetical protein